MEELKNEMELTEVEETYEPEEELEVSGGILKKVVVGVGAVTVGAVGALAVKNRDKLKTWKEERTIKKLRDGGYVVFKPEEDFDELEDFDDEYENFEEEK